MIISGFIMMNQRLLEALYLFTFTNFIDLEI